MPTCLTELGFKHTAARVLYGMSVVTVTTGSYISIPCFAEGPVGLGFSWFMNYQQRIEWGPRWKIRSFESRSMLIIRKAETKDTGQYTCLAR